MLRIPSFREIQYAIMDDRKENYNDIPGEYLQPAIRMDEAVANLLVDKKAFGLSLNRKRYSSAQLNIYEARGVYDYPGYRIGSRVDARSC